MVKDATITTKNVKEYYKYLKNHKNEIIILEFLDNDKKINDESIIIKKIIEHV